jgi:hypothetical protein
MGQKIDPLQIPSDGVGPLFSLTRCSVPGGKSLQLHVQASITNSGTRNLMLES